MNIQQTERFKLLNKRAEELINKMNSLNAGINEMEKDKIQPVELSQLREKYKILKEKYNSILTEQKALIKSLLK